MDLAGQDIPQATPVFWIAGLSDKSVSELGRRDRVWRCLATVVPATPRSDIWNQDDLGAEFWFAHRCNSIETLLMACVDFSRAELNAGVIEFDSVGVLISKEEAEIALPEEASVTSFDAEYELDSEVLNLILRGGETEAYATVHKFRNWE